ncbi:flagellar hook-basal body complex protein FliE [Desulfitobacterium dehalogenans ATCC 51507]|uniref:Flagellar hook-basal body complex protein FliE n=1 Tax=Desulfitobacterium dehalogenans (strain ATCC 51507 / DSM 9161 / JW/IU-DC1) TaxID=756499 RepID=I4ACX3_DESDJ|nr:flagellar hook-basal body complex protein FliE [Desulfitobacterium dehalogenans]AFM01808.1 flagellar hook-basal body complex protein FliE [Desulfitobacterium dehalogenans ATCC 51507]
MAINPIVPVNPLMMNQTMHSIQENNPVGDKGSQVPAGAGKVGADFRQFLQEALHKVDNLQKEADVASLGLATGQIQDLHTAVLAIEKAGLSLSLTVEVRNRALDAYHEVMRMQI